MNTVNFFTPAPSSSPARTSGVQHQELDLSHSRRLLGVVRHAMNAGYSLIEFVDDHREAARQAGVETIAIELSGMIDSGKLESVADTLHDSTLQGKATHLSEEGLQNVRRAERLLADAAASLKKYGDARTMPVVMAGESKLLGQSVPPPAPQGGFKVGLTDILLLVAIGLLIGILVLKSK